MVRTVLSRTSYQSEPEREAEVLASLILTRAQRATVPVMPVTDVWPKRPRSCAGPGWRWA